MTCFVSIKKRKQFLETHNKGYKSVSRSFVVFVLKEETALDTNIPKVGITVSKKNGNAVARNRIKRRIRSVVSTTFTENPTLSSEISGYLVCIIAKKQSEFTDFTIMQKEFKNAIKKFIKSNTSSSN